MGKNAKYQEEKGAAQIILYSITLCLYLIKNQMEKEGEKWPTNCSDEKIQFFRWVEDWKSAIEAESYQTQEENIDEKGFIG